MRGGERGHDHVERRLTDLGASPRRGRDPARWLLDALDEVGARRLRHRGNHRYAFRLGRDRRERERVEVALDPRPFPKAVDADRPAWVDAS